MEALMAGIEKLIHLNLEKRNGNEIHKNNNKNRSSSSSYK